MKFNVRLRLQRPRCKNSNLANDYSHVWRLAARCCNGTVGRLRSTGRRRSGGTDARYVMIMLLPSSSDALVWQSPCFLKQQKQLWQQAVNAKPGCQPVATRGLLGSQAHVAPFWEPGSAKLLLCDHQAVISSSSYGAERELNLIAFMLLYSTAYNIK